MVKDAIKNNLLLFTEWMGYNKKTGKANAPFHEEYYNYLQYKFSPLEKYPNKEKAVMKFWPRGHGKSETTDFNYLSWIIGNNKDIHTNIVSKTATLSEEILLALMTRIEFSERYQAIFGELKPDHARKWTTKEIIIKRDFISKNPTVKATGLMGPITGGRSNLIICDDIIDEENVRTPLQIEKTLTWHNKILVPTLYPWGAEIIIGTRWHYADIYSALMNVYPFEVKKAIIETELYCTSLWPDYWPLWKLTEKRNKIGSIIFDCQYQNDPTGMEGSILKSEWLKPWNSPPTNECEYYAGIDPSLGEADYFGIATVALNRRTGLLFLVDVWAEHMPFPDIIKHKLPELHRLYKYRKVYIETNFWQKLLLSIPEIKRMPCVPVKTVRDKTSRFITMSSHFESGRIVVNPLLLRRSEFWREWVQFPRGQHDDAVDAVDLVVSKLVGTNRKAVMPGFLLR